LVLSCQEQVSGWEEKIVGESELAETH